MAVQTARLKIAVAIRTESSAMRESSLNNSWTINGVTGKWTAPVRLVAALLR